ncbi:MAG TPA: hypothetical protein VHE99_01920 [Gammaproteobacteria bacterium]|nr:hypothetical protein [Gammaproteobacteria bacterium]
MSEDIRELFDLMRNLHPNALTQFLTNPWQILQNNRRPISTGMMIFSLCLLLTAALAELQTTPSNSRIQIQHFIGMMFLMIGVILRARGELAMLPQAAIPPVVPQHPHDAKDDDDEEKPLLQSLSPA